MPVTVRCTACSASLAAHSRSEFSLFQESHQGSCDCTWLAIDGSLDDIMALPPYATDETGSGLRRQ